MNILLACMHVYHVHDCCPQRPEEGVVFPGTGVTDVCEPQCELGIEPGSLKLLNCFFSSFIAFL